MEQITTNPAHESDELPGSGAKARTDTGLRSWTKPALQVIPLNEALSGNVNLNPPGDSITYYS